MPCIKCKLVIVYAAMQNVNGIMCTDGVSNTKLEVKPLKV